MHLDPVLSALFTIATAALLVGLLLRRLNQPHVVSYILAGIVLGPGVFGLITDAAAVSQFGAVGVVMLLFFVGLEVSPEQLIAQWRVALIGTLLQVLLGFGVIWLAGHYLDWPLGRVVLLSFVITLSSTAVVLKLLEQWRLFDHRVGQNVLGILLVQDFLVVPMLILISILGGETLSPVTIAKQVIGAILLIGVTGWTIARSKAKTVLFERITQDTELQLFAALSLCFGLAVLTGWLELSTALGAFAAGLIIGQRYETHWLHESLAPLRDLFVALFFLSVGLLIDVQFMLEHIGPLLLMVSLVMIINTLINATILRTFGEPWRDALHGGVILSQIGEFSFVLAAVGLNVGLITQVGYQFTLALIALSLALSPAYIVLVRRIFKLRVGE